MRLALEALGVAQPQPTIVDTLIDQLKLIDAEDALRDSLEEMDVLIHTYQSLESIHQAIKTCGVTQSIVHLYGENFSSMESDQPGDAEKKWKRRNKDFSLGSGRRSRICSRSSSNGSEVFSSL